MVDVYGRNSLITHPNGSKKGIDQLTVFGCNQSVDSGGPAVDVWGKNALWAAPTAARRLNLVSDSADDAALGTGARKCLVEGLDLDFKDQSEIVPLDGLTPVLTTKEYLRNNLLRCTSFGGSRFNQGRITATAETDDTDTGIITPKDGRSLQAIYTVPAGKTAHITGIGRSINKKGVGPAAEAVITWHVRLNADQPDSGWVTGWVDGVVHGGSSNTNNEFTPAEPLPEKTDIRMSVLAVTGMQLDITAYFQILLIDD